MKLSIGISLLAVTVLLLAPPFPEAPAGFDNKTNGMVDDATHAADQAKFDETEALDDGLGPLYNTQSCRECHQNPTSGGPSQVTELRVGHAGPHGEFVNPEIPIARGTEVIKGRSLVNDRAICPNAAFPGTEIQERVPDSENIRTFRVSLNVFPIQIPALRERHEDIPLLVRYFVQRFSRSLNKQVEYIPAEAMDVLASYSWPGNVRELENLIERAVLLSPGKELRIPTSELKSTALATAAGADSSSFSSASFPSSSSLTSSISTLEEAERQHILRALKQTQWRIAGTKGAATLLAMKRTTLQARMRKLGIRRPV